MRLLGFPAPRYAHVPLLTDETGRRLSKRDGDLDFAALRQRWRAPQLTGYLACAAGLLPSPEPVTPAELIAEFDWQRSRRNPGPLQQEDLTLAPAQSHPGTGQDFFTAARCRGWGFAAYYLPCKLASWRG